MRCPSHIPYPERHSPPGHTFPASSSRHAHSIIAIRIISSTATHEVDTAHPAPVISPTNRAAADSFSAPPARFGPRPPESEWLSRCFVTTKQAHQTIHSSPVSIPLRRPPSCPLLATDHHPTFHTPRVVFRSCVVPAVPCCARVRNIVPLCRGRKLPKRPRSPRPICSIFFPSPLYASII